MDVGSQCAGMAAPHWKALGRPPTSWTDDIKRVEITSPLFACDRRKTFTWRRSGVSSAGWSDPAGSGNSGTTYNGRFRPSSETSPEKAEEGGGLAQKN
ncbi:jg5420 [Pararge aegeria aegeria]|uniref:Jg5420 protein n=1 Tax=Pararge aegeria aegeria TaxID=348720 RepID=A0A8S4S9Z5_9NEOP|nr:jg5420 [Pararge aegeria aegeria]